MPTKDYKKMANISSQTALESPAIIPKKINKINKRKLTEPKFKASIKDNSKKNLNLLSRVFGISATIIRAIFIVLFFWTIPIFILFSKQINSLKKWLSLGENSIKFIGGTLFVIILLNLVNLQILGNSQLFNGNSKSANPTVYDIIPAKRGNIFFKDLSQNRTDLPLTVNQIRYNITFSPSTLKLQKFANINQVAEVVSSRTNISINEITSKFSSEIEKENPSQYSLLQKEATEEQKNAILNMKQDKSLDKIYGFSLWLGVEEVNVRTYPEEKLLAQTVGYTPKYQMDATEAKKREGCKVMVEQNQARKTDMISGYQVGDRGIEEKYCSVLGGLNGKRINNQDLTNEEKIRDQVVVDGADVYLTIDKNIQRKAESVLEEAVRKNTNQKGAPKDGCVMVMEANSGKILALASYPSFDPNYYSEYDNNNPNSFRNSCTSNDYEVGSVVKPLTVAIGLQLGQTNTKENGKEEGITPNYKFEDFDEKGKPYKDGDNTIYIKNANSFSWKKFGKIGLKEILRDSINTGIADIVDKIGNKNLKQYFLEKLEFGNSANLINFPGDTNGNTSSFYSEANCVYCYAAKGFGQGFSISALQLVKAYTSIANDGKLVQARLIDKIQCGNNFQKTCDSTNTILENEPKANQIFSKQVADQVTDYMVSTTDEGYLDEGPTKASVTGYKIASKSGTAQVSRPIVSNDGKPSKPCDQNCNTARGIYDHTFIGYNTGSTKYIVMIKLAEPRPGLVENFASTTLGVYFSEMMRYTLTYLDVPKESK